MVDAVGVGGIHTVVGCRYSRKNELIGLIASTVRRFVRWLKNKSLY